MNISQDIQDAISNNLPGLAAEELKKFINKAQETERMLAGSNSELAAARDKLASLQKKLDEHRTIDEREQDAKTREQAVRTKELDLEVREAKLVASSALAELKGVKETTNLFLRNTVIHNNVTESVPVAVPHTPPGVGYNTQGQPAMVMTHPATSSTTTSTGLEPPPAGSGN